MKNVFLFFGAHDGSMVKQLDVVTNSNVYGNDIVWDEVHLFEPQDAHEQLLRTLESTDPRVRYHKSAVSTINSIETFYIKGDPSLGYMSSTLDEKKFAGQLYHTLQVNVVNIIEWIRDNTNENDFVCIDMDIECEEYNILPAFIESDIMDRIKFISVEFHANKSHKWSVDHFDIQMERYLRHKLGNKFLDHNMYYA